MIALERLAPDGTEIRGSATLHPCSQAQQRFWFAEQLHPHNPGLNIAVRWRLEGKLSDAHLTQAWQQLVARHAGLRTAFTERDGEPMQRVEARLDFEIRRVDLRNHDPAQRAAEADRLASIEAHTTFDISVAPLIRVTRLVLDDETSTLLVTTHHAVCDGWSIGILARDMGVICARLQGNTLPALPDLPIDYVAYAAWERDWAATAGALEAETAYAQTLLHDYVQFELLPDYPRPPVQTANGNITSLLLERALTDGLAGIARTHGCTLFVAALSALLTLLQRYSGETDITLATQVAGRDDEDLENVVGCFINTIALRGDLTADPTFGELLARTRDAVAETFEMRHVPLERLVDAVKPKRDLSRNALFSVNFIFQRSFISNADYGDFALVDLPSRSAGALYDLNFFMVERPEGWRASCEYNTDLFAPDTIEALLVRFCNVIGAVVQDPTQRLAAIPVLSAADRHQLVVEANATDFNFPVNQTLPCVFAAQAARAPDAIAVVCGNASLTYGELDSAANRLARELTSRGVTRGTRVGVLLDRTPQLVVALLAVLKTGAAYIPLDPGYPRERLAYIVGNSKLITVITRASLTDRLAASESYIAVDTDVTAIAGNSAEPFDRSAAADLAYVIYTSGSTGRPKGVQIQHSALLNFLWAMRERPGLAQADTLVAVTTVSFDIAALELFLPLIVGAKVVIATESDVIDGHALLQLLQRTQATIMQATPISWQLLIDAGWAGNPALTMLCGGEALARTLADQLLDRGGELWNMYGPTETTVWSAVTRVSPGSGPVLIGPPIANTQFYVLDDSGCLVPPGVPGELYIGGDGVALGYFERAELTAERFVPDGFRRRPEATLYRTGDIVRTRPGGNIEFLGRADHQIKLRGFRIELGEIETALLRQSSVVEAVAIVAASALGEPAIWAYVAGAPNALTKPDWTSTLRSRLAEFLPGYMLPAAIVALPALPHTPNGKIDRNALPLPPTLFNAASGIASPPLGTTEIQLAAVVAELLRREHVSRNDDFFALGFHSLLTVRLSARITQTFGVSLPLRAVFDNPTVAALAKRIEAIPVDAVMHETSPGGQPVVTFNPRGAQIPFLYFHNDVWFDGAYCRELAVLTGPDQPFCAIAPHGTAGLAQLTSIEAMARDYVARIREIQPQGPYRIGGSCAGGYVAYELARLLRAQGETIEQLVLVNASLPPLKNVLFGDALLRRIGLDATLEARWRETITWNAVRFFDALGTRPLDALQFALRRLRVVISRRTHGDTAPPRNADPFEKHSGSPETESHFANLIAAYTYHPKQYDGDITLVMGTSYVAASIDPTLGWGSLTRGVRVLTIPSGFLLPLQDNITALGRVLGSVFRT